MKFQNLAASVACAVALAAAPLMALAKVSPEEAAKLGIEGTELTPMGAIRAGNADGSIPAWEGGIKTPPAGYTRGGWYIDPYADDQVLFTITAQNHEQYKDKLSTGQPLTFHHQHRANPFCSQQPCNFAERHTRADRLNVRSLGLEDRGYIHGISPLCVESPTGAQSRNRRRFVRSPH